MLVEGSQDESLIPNEKIIELFKGVQSYLRMCYTTSTIIDQSFVWMIA